VIRQIGLSTYVTPQALISAGQSGVAHQTTQESAAILSSDVNPPRIGHVDCDKQNLLCTTWSAAIPEIWHFLISVPAVGEPRGASPLHIIPIFPRNVTTQYIVKIHTEKTYLDQPEYTGAYHPIDGSLQKFGILEPLGYVMWGFGTTPSWLLMIGISFFSRQIMLVILLDNLCSGATCS
jgi:hypothetical protein